MPMLRKLRKEHRARIENGAADMVRLHGEKAREVALARSKQTRGKHQPVSARYWSLVAIAISRLNDLNFPPG